MPASERSRHILHDQATPEALVVPIVWLFDGSPFAMAARKSIEQFQSQDWYRGCVFGTTERAEIAIAERFSRAFYDNLSPLLPFEEELTWVVWLVQQDPAAQSHLRSIRSQFAQMNDRKLRHLVFWLVKSSAGGKITVERDIPHGKRQKRENPTARTEPPNEELLEFFMSEDGAIQRDSAELGATVGAYALSSWRRYWQEYQPENLRTALGLDHLDATFPAYTLGVAYNKPDLRYHGAVWAAQIEHYLRQEWTAQHVATVAIAELSSFQLNSPDRVLRSALPESAYYFAISSERDNEEGSENNHALSNSLTAIQITFPNSNQKTDTWVFGAAPNSHSSRVPHDTRRRDWPQDRGKFAEYAAFLKLLSANARQAMAHAIREEKARMEMKIVDFIEGRGKIASDSTPEDCPAGHIKRSQLKLARVEAALKPWTQAKWYDTATTAASLKVQLDHIDQAVQEVPARKGLLFRLLLIASGVFCPIFGADLSSVTFLITDVIVLQSIMGATVCILLFALIATWEFRTKRERLKSLLGEARDDIERQHLREVVKSAVTLIRETGGQLHQLKVSAESPWNDLRQHLLVTGETHQHSCLSEPKNKNKTFPSESLKPLLAKHREMMLRKLHRGIKEELRAFGSRITCPTPQQFDQMIPRLAKNIADDTLENFSYGEFMRSAIPQEEAQRRLLVLLATTAVKPALLNVHSAIPAFRLFAPDGWRVNPEGRYEIEKDWLGDALVLVLPIGITAPPTAQ